MKGQGFASMDKDKLLEITSKGGRKKHPNKGFASRTKKERSKISKLGAKARWAKVKENHEIQ